MDKSLKKKKKGHRRKEPAGDHMEEKAIFGGVGGVTMGNWSLS